MTLLEELKARGVFKDSIGDVEKLLEEPQTVYCGFDPTADSLHIGSLLPIVTLKRFQQAGHKAIVLLGNATAMIGDPSGKSSERVLMSEKEISHNVVKLMQFFTKVFGWDVLVLQNRDWLDNINFLEFLRDVGKHFNVNTMLNHESVSSRLETGISFTEFSYSLLQAYDFVTLNREHECKLQIGGSDQWSNIISGVQLGRKLDCSELFGMTTELLLDSDGNKIGKTSSGRKIWLSPKKTTPFEFHQFFMTLADADAESLMLKLSLSSLQTIRELVEEHRKEPGRRLLQKALADEMTTFVHGTHELSIIRRAQQLAFENPATCIVPEEVRMVAPFLVLGEQIVSDAFVLTGLVESKTEFRKGLKSGAISVSGTKVLEDRKLEVGDMNLSGVGTLKFGRHKVVFLVRE